MGQDRTRVGVRFVNRSASVHPVPQKAKGQWKFKFPSDVRLSAGRKGVPAVSGRIISRPLLAIFQSLICHNRKDGYGLFVLAQCVSLDPHLSGERHQGLGISAANPW